jgi:GntR family carbon starvation induced transcriptional regulator
VGIETAPPAVGGPPTRTDWAEEILRGDIISGRLKPGERIKIGELVERYHGLSPTPLREALSRLAGSGLVEVVPQRGVRVAKGSLEELHDIYDIRVLLETVALRRSFSNAKNDEKWPQEVEDAFEAFSATSYPSENEDDPNRSKAWEEAHFAFHLALLSRCRSPWLLRLVRQLYDHSTRYRNLSLAVRGSRKDVLGEHQKIRDAVMAGDRRAALAARQEHQSLTVTSRGDALE